MRKRDRLAAWDLRDSKSFMRTMNQCSFVHVSSNSLVFQIAEVGQGAKENLASLNEGVRVLLGEVANEWLQSKPNVKWTS